MRMNVFALPALTAFLFSLNNLMAEMPWMDGVLNHTPIHVAEEVMPAPAAPTQETRTVKLTNNQTITAMLVAQGVDKDSAADAADTLSDVYNAKRFKAGQEVELQLEHDADTTRLIKMAFAPDATQRIELTKDAEENFNAQRIARNVEKRIVAIRGTVDGAFAASVRRAGAPRSVANQMAKWLAYDIDFQRDVHKGDQFAVMFPADYDDKGEMIQAGDVQFLRVENAKTKINLYRYNEHMYHADGRDVHKALLKTPVDGARITSGFGMRVHPILGYSAMHKGIDFGAAYGSPIFAAGDGVIEHAGPFSSYGNYVLIHHNGTFDTAYAHLSRFGKGIRVGTRVHQGQVIGYVGATGRATGPHLHFEVHEHGVQVNPTKVASLGNDKLEGKELNQLASIVRQDDNQFAQLIAKAQPKMADNDVKVIPGNATAVR
jgi:murein DD-endopeptidase MepM/ murein hydrolase activator NlpD